MSANDRFTVNGPVTLQTVTGLNASAQVLFAAPGSTVTFDLSGVGVVDSAALAWLLELRRSAAARDVRIRFDQVPPRLHTLAESAGLGQLLTV